MLVHPSFSKDQIVHTIKRMSSPQCAAIIPVFRAQAQRSTDIPRDPLKLGYIIYMCMGQIIRDDSSLLYGVRYCHGTGLLSFLALPEIASLPIWASRSPAY